MRRFISRREALVWLGGLVTVGCGSSEPDAASPAPKPTTPAPTPIASSPPPVASSVIDASAPEVDAAPPLPSTPEALLAGVESIVVVMMENRSFDHFLGSLAQDASYAAKSNVEGLSGTESNPAPDGSTVTVFKMANFTPEDPPHGWNAAHNQWNDGKNDGFVKAHAGASQSEVMGYHDRDQLPFYYWLADHFTICDHWFSSVLGPTWPNRFYLHACSSGGKKDNTGFFIGAPPTVWARLKDAGKTFKNYTAGIVAWYAGGFTGELGNINPIRNISEFFDDAKNGTLPNFALIDPDFSAADDHPSHDIKLGQAFVASIYKAIAESPQWKKTLLIVTYDENGGFFDHVAPPAAADDRADFRQLGFRVPAFVIGGMVKQGHVEKTVFEHSSVAATLKTRFGIQSLGQRMDAAASLASCIDPARAVAPGAPPPNMPVPQLSLGSANPKVGPSSQPELMKLVETRAIPAWAVDTRPDAVRLADWLRPAERLRAVKFTRT